ncbi:MAG: hypothetical protein DWQ37_17630 [Planctomycetota bacterium]|nr:MAG: hypothetical protein DWQ37_17630 [Planctomycetota bacterium]
MTRTIHCTAVEVSPVCDPYLPAPRGFADLVPWADPYIAALLHKLDRAAALDEAFERAELPPPLDGDDREEVWEADWTPRNWPRA